MQDQEIRIGVYVCHCGSNIAANVKISEVIDFAAKLPAVVIARDYMYMCSEPGQNIIKEDIKNLGLNRVVVAACSPTLHEPTFRRACQEAGLNAYLFDQSNIREHCSWVTEDIDKATAKAKALVSSSVSRVYYLQPLEAREVPLNQNTVVVGGGIAGIAAALEIAESGHQVYLIEKEPSIGGHMAQLDKTFPTLDCSSCILTPKMTQVGSHPNIHLMTYSEVEKISGYVGNFKVNVKKKARFVDEDKCTGCGICQTKCPYKVNSEFEAGMGKRKAIYIPFPQAVPNIPVIDAVNCAFLLKGKCRVCEKFCEAGAIDYEQKDSIVELEVGSIILTTGYNTFNAARIEHYGYDRLDNVITGLEFERMVSASGPTQGKIICKDESEPKTVAIVHCVGSRDENYNAYCSRICCMQALKYSHLIKDKTGADIYQFYIDMRCFGKGYEEFYKRLASEEVNFIRGKVSEVTNRYVNKEEHGKLVVIAEDTLLKNIIRLPVDMVILCTAIEPQANVESVARIFHINRSADGFFMERHPKLDPISTTTEGIFIAGCCQGPKDIPDTVAQASAAAARVLSLIGKGKVIVEAATSIINDKACSGCRLCNNLCPFGAISYVEADKRSNINEALCKGCGVCVASCPSSAITGRHFTNQQIMAQIEGIMR